MSVRAPSLFKPEMIKLIRLFQYSLFSDCENILFLQPELE